MLRNRYRRIVLFFARLLLSFVWWDLVLARLGLRQIARRTRVERLQRSARAFRSLAVQMGGVLIKVGQFLSTRVDVLPKEFTDELAGLQDEVPPVPYPDIRRVAEAEYGMPLLEKFASFDPHPMAAASLGQVHRATIVENGDEKPRQVVVKIQRPDIEKIIATDLAALRTVGNWLKRYRPISRRANVPALLGEFTRILYEEIDYLAEGRNAETFAANFRDDTGVRVPKVVWTHTTTRALTLENVFSIKITDYEALTAAGIDRKEVASRLLDTYLKQIFEDGFFHADPHPGNLFVYPCPPGDGGGAALEASLVAGRVADLAADLNVAAGGNGRRRRSARAAKNGDGNPAGESDAQSVEWQLTFVDFGMVGHVPPTLRQGLREMLIAVGTKDAARIVKSYQMVDVLLPSADLQLLEQMEARAFERFWGKNMTELAHISTAEMHEFASEFRELIYTMPFQVPQDIIFLARCVGILSGMCTGLDPEFNVWTHLAPYAQKLIADETRAAGRDFLEELRVMARAFLGFPVKMDAFLDKLERGEVAVRTPEVLRQVTRLEMAIYRLVAGVVFGSLLLGGVLLLMAGQSGLGYAMLGSAALSLLWILLAGRRYRP
jgi:predicted unusual protein kinase regulating ubiquinone biosynthesis (AarF/ABC1/UbiB family)